MNGDKLPQDMLNFSKKITESVSDLVQNILQDVLDLKKAVMSEYLNAVPSGNHDVGLMIKTVSKYSELKGYIKSDIAGVLNKMFKQWTGELDSMRSSVLAELENRVQSYDLELSDFSAPNYNPPAPSFVNWRNSIINSAFSRDARPSLGNSQFPHYGLASETKSLGAPSASSQNIRYALMNEPSKNSSLCEDHTGRSPNIHEGSGLYPKLDDMNGTGFLKRKRSSFSNASPSELLTIQKKSRKSAGPVLEVPFDVSYEDEEIEDEDEEMEEEEEEIEQTPPPPVVSAKTKSFSSNDHPGRGRSRGPTKRQSAEQSARGRSSRAVSQGRIAFGGTGVDKLLSPPARRGRRSRSQSPVGKFPKDGSPMSYSNIDLEPDDAHSALWNHSMWYLLSAIPEKGNIPEMPAVYQVKVKQAKKCAYIGVCDNLRSTLMGYKNGESSGMKQLDKFIDRNRDSIEIQCLVCSSFDVADLKRANQLAVFRKNFLKNPAYNV